MLPVVRRAIAGVPFFDKMAIAANNAPPTYDEGSGDKQSSECKDYTVLSHTEKRRLVTDIFRKFTQLDAEHQLRLGQLKLEKKNKDNWVHDECDQACAAIEAARLESGLKVRLRGLASFSTRTSLLTESRTVEYERARDLRKQFMREVDELIDGYEMLLGKVWIKYVRVYISLVIPPSYFC